MIKNQKGFGAITVIITLLVVAAIGGVYYSISKQTRVTITNDNAAFSFDLGVSAHQTTRTDSTNATKQFYEAPLAGSDAKLVASIYVPQITSVKSDASCGAHASFKATILGAEHTVCNQNNLLYIANFNNNQDWYQASVFSSDLKTTVDQQTVVKLLSSIEKK